ncbi:MAG: glycosyl hydrolase [Ignavibacteriae bacterium]|nr:glycosyl hydrolase [Ignavibacteriota bacterium]
MIVDMVIRAEDLRGKAARVFACSEDRLRALLDRWDVHRGAPVITAGGVYQPRGWTEWTLGFHFGSALLHAEATGNTDFLARGKAGTYAHMTSHLTHAGIHDHGFHIVSTYGNILRGCHLGWSGLDEADAERARLALAVSGAVQAGRWTALAPDLGFIHSFNGPHSLFVDTIRTLRVLALAHLLGQSLLSESDARVSLLHRLVRHGLSTATYNVYYGEGRDVYDVPGRTAHEAVFNVHDGSFRTPATHQGYSAYSTWSRGLAWALCGFSELLPFLDALPADAFPAAQPKDVVLAAFERAARATADYYIRNTPRDGIPFWDDGAPGLAALGDWRARDADPYNDVEPVDSSAAAIAAQGFLRLGAWLLSRSSSGDGAGTLCTAAGLGLASRLFDEPYLSLSPDHEGLLLHSVYHRPKGWDHLPPGSKIPRGEASQWGDYHARELALCVLRLADGASLPRFDEGLMTAGV